MNKKIENAFAELERMETLLHCIDLICSEKLPDYHSSYKCITSALFDGIERTRISLYSADEDCDVVSAIYKVNNMNEE